MLKNNEKDMFLKLFSIKKSYNKKMLLPLSRI